jgi:hypothetical protein
MLEFEHAFILDGFAFPEVTLTRTHMQDNHVKQLFDRQRYVVPATVFQLKRQGVMWVWLKVLVVHFNGLKVLIDIDRATVRLGQVGAQGNL